MQKVLPYFIILFVFACKSPYQQTTGIAVSGTDSMSIVEKDTLIPFVYPVNEVSLQLSQILNTENKNDLTLLSVYNRNGNNPLWRSLKQKQEGLMLIDSCIFHGLNTYDYNSKRLKALYQKLSSDTIFNTSQHAQFDIQLTKSLIKYISHLQKGKLNPKSFWPSWNYPINSNEINDSVLVQLITENKLTGIDSLFQPKNMLYKKLKQEIKAWYINTEPTYENIKYPGFVIKTGDSNTYVLQLKNRLQQKNYLRQDSLTMAFDSITIAALKKFQQKHGLNPDGKPGKRTYAFLNWKRQNYIDVLKVNLERLRWMFSEVPDNYIWVNIPEYKLKLYLRNQPQMQAKVVVGKYKNQTPVFSSAINYLVFNPCWTIPNSIANKSILPRYKKDSTFLVKRKMFIGKNGVEVNPSTVSFSDLAKENSVYKIYQRSSKSNALGKVKFMFDNKYSIYLHDTPSQSLFKKDYRALSHGCVRVQNALNIAGLILFDYDQHSRSIEFYLKKGYPDKVYLNKELPIMIHYYTCGYNYKSGVVQFYSDVYAKDYKVLEALSK